MTTPNLTQLLLKAIQSRGESNRGPMPASVQVYNPALQVVDVAPLIQVYVGEDLVDLPVLRNVPFSFPRGGTSSITWPLVAGDVVYLVPAEGDISLWHSTGRKAPPQTKRRFSLSDVVATPGPGSMANPLPPTAYDPTAMVLAAALIKLGSSTAVNPVALSVANDSNWTRFATWAATLEAALAAFGVPITPSWAASGGSRSTAATKVVAE